MHPLLAQAALAAGARSAMKTWLAGRARRHRARLRQHARPGDRVGGRPAGPLLLALCTACAWCRWRWPSMRRHVRAGRWRAEDRRRGAHAARQHHGRGHDGGALEGVAPRLACLPAHTADPDDHSTLSVAPLAMAGIAAAAVGCMCCPSAAAQADRRVAAVKVARRSGAGHARTRRWACARSGRWLQAPVAAVAPGQPGQGRGPGSTWPGATPRAGRRWPRRCAATAWRATGSVARPACMAARGRRGRRAALWPRAPGRAGGAPPRLGRPGDPHQPGGPGPARHGRLARDLAAALRAVS